MRIGGSNLVPVPHCDDGFRAPSPRLRNGDEALTADLRRERGGLLENRVPRRKDRGPKVFPFHGQSGGDLYGH